MKWYWLLILGFVGLLLVGCGQKSSEKMGEDLPAWWEGRWIPDGEGGMQADWPATALHLRFTGEALWVEMSGNSVYGVRIDGKIFPKFAITQKHQKLLVASGLGPGAHELLLYRRSESQLETSVIHKIILTKSGQFLEAPPRPTRRIEIIGDSFAMGFGIEGALMSLQGAARDSMIFWTTNAWQAFGPQVARMLHAEFQLNALSGRGLVRNYNNNEPGRHMPYFYPYALLSKRTLKQYSPSLPSKTA